MSVKISESENIGKIQLKVQGSNPASPGAGFWFLFVKSGGIFAENAAGTVIGPFVDATSIPALSASTPADVASAGAAGSGGLVSKSDHAHRGVASLAKNGSAALYGAVTLSGGTNVTLTQSANDISIAASGGGGGSVATDTIFDAKGDLAVGTGSDTAARLAVGSNGQVLTADSGEATGTKWATPSGGGGGGVGAHASMWHDEATVIAGNALTLVADGSQRFGMFAYQNTPADGDTFEQAFGIAAGTYTLYVLGLTGNEKAIIDWYIDGVAVVTGQDWYSVSTPVYNVIKTAGGIVISAGAHVLRGVINGKNASASSYQMLLTKYYFK